MALPRRSAVRTDGASAFIAAATVLAGALVLWLISGVAVGEITRYLAYEAVFVVAPGWLVLRALSPATRGVGWQLALGWPIGLLLEILSFSLTAALDWREAFLAYPIVLGVAAELVRRARSRQGGPAAARPPSLTRAGTWSLAGLCLLAFAYIGLAYHGPAPLPGSVPAAFYVPDITFNLVLSGEALHHWPITEAKVVDGLYGYHYFANLHMAAAAQVTGIELPTILLRLYVLPLIALLLLQLGLIGSAVTRLTWAGPVTAALFLLVQEIDLSIIDIRPFQGVGPIPLWSSPSQLLGLVFFVPLVFLLYRLIETKADPSEPLVPGLGRPALWALFLILLIGSGGAKAVIPPMLIGGLLVYLAWRLLKSRALDRAALVALGCCAAVQAAYILVLYGSGSSSLRLEPGATFEQMVAFTRPLDLVSDSPPAEIAFWALAVPIATLMFFGAPLLGLLWLRDERGPLHPGQALLLAILLAGLPAFFLLQHDGHSQLYFPLYGIVAALPLAAAGLCRFFARLDRPPGVRWRPLAGILACWVAALVLLALWTEQIALDGHPVRADLVSYGLAAAVIAAAAVVAIRSSGSLGSSAAAFAALGVLTIAVLDVPLDVLPNSLRRLERGEPLHTSGPIETRRAAIQGMEWMRDHLDTDSVLAVSNDHTARARAYAPLDNTFPAFSERRTLLEGWAYTARATALGQADVIAHREDPFPERRALERRVFAKADRAALNELIARYGVTHLVVDRKHGIADPDVRGLGRLVFSNPLLYVIEVR